MAMLRMTPKIIKKSLKTHSAKNSLKAVLAGVLLGGATLTSVSCDAPASKEDLNQEGPPMIRQVFINEKVATAGGSAQLKNGQLAFGSHPDAVFDNDDGTVITAAIRGAQEIRIVLDEQVRGNRLEEVACAGDIGGGAGFSAIPDGTTPDDIADCAGPADAIKNTCKKVCIHDDGTPVGILDANEDGAPDQLRMIDYNPDPNIVELGVQVICGGNPVEMSQVLSFWNPSGNQTISSNPALGYKGIGPVLVLRPIAGVGMPANVACTVQFRSEVVDHDGNQICAPEGGVIENGCEPGDTTRVGFGTEAIEVVGSDPRDDAMNVNLDDSSFLGVYFNANIDAASVNAITLTANGTPVTIAPVVEDDDKTSIFVVLDPAAPFEPDTEYVLTLGTGLTDLFGQGLAEDVIINWTTTSAAPTPDAATPDAGAPDAA